MNNEKGTIVLTSTGLSAEPVRQGVEKYFSTLTYRSVAIVTTAADGKENNKYSKLAKSQFKDAGFDVIEFIDIEKNRFADFSQYSVVYVCGGDTFKLLKYAREANFKEAIEKLLERGGIYIGVSAGAIILAPTIQIAASVDADQNDAGTDMTNFTGLSIIDFEIHPHYIPDHDKELSSYQETTKNKVIKIANSEAIIISNSKQEFVK